MEADTRSKNSLAWPFALMLLGACLGAILGWAWAMHEVRSISEQAKQTSEGLDCGAGAVAILYGSRIAGFVAGALPGVIALLVVGLRGARREKSDWAAYYGG